MKISSEEVVRCQKVIDYMMVNGLGAYSSGLSSQVGFKARRYLNLCCRLGLMQRSEMKSRRGNNTYYLLTPNGRFENAAFRANIDFIHERILSGQKQGRVYGNN